MVTCTRYSPGWLKVSVVAALPLYGCIGLPPLSASNLGLASATFTSPGPRYFAIVTLTGACGLVIGALAPVLFRHVPFTAIYVVFRLVGRDYEAAVSAGAFCGFAMGATATAIANMQAIVGRYGPAPKSFVVVPIVGAFFVDLMNLAVLTVFLLPGFIIRP